MWSSRVAAAPGSETLHEMTMIFIVMLMMVMMTMMLMMLMMLSPGQAQRSVASSCESPGGQNMLSLIIAVIRKRGNFNHSLQLQFF